MKIGLAMFPTDYAIPPAELGRLAEEHGFECLLFPEHTHIPTSRKTPYPGGGDLPDEYSHTHDPFVALAQVAAVTERILGLQAVRTPATVSREPQAPLATVRGCSQTALFARSSLMPPASIELAHAV